TDVSPSPLLMNSALVVNLNVAGCSTGIAIVNPSQSVANVQLVATNSQGGQILSQTISIVPNGQFSRFLNQLFAGQITLATPLAGLLTITADAPVGVVALNFRDQGFGASPLTSLSSPFPLPVATIPSSATVTTSTSATNGVTVT